MTTILLRAKSGTLMAMCMWVHSIWAKRKGTGHTFTRGGTKSTRVSFRTIYGTEKVNNELTKAR